MLKSLYNQNISRTYMDDQGHRVMLAVAYTQIQTDRTRVHRPEVCYPSQGFELVSQKDEQTLVEGRSLPVRRMVTRRQDRKEYVSYWVMIGDTPVVSTRDEKIRQIKYGLHLEIPDNLLFRVSSTDDSEAEAFRRHDAFIQAMMRNVDPRQLSSLIGQPNAAPRGGV
jgi:EpsI family protein